MTHFCVGNQGHDPNSPISALTPDPGINPTPDISGDSLPDDLVFGPKAVSGAAISASFAPVWTCLLDKGEATGEVSSYYLMAKFVYPNTHALYNKLWIWSYSLAPLKVKTDNEDWTLEMGVQF